MPILGNCCFFLDLKVGTHIIGALCLISAIMNTLTFVMPAVAIGLISGGTDEVHTAVHKEVNKPFDFGDDDDYADANEVAQANLEGTAEIMDTIKNHVDTVKVVCYCLLFFSLFCLIAASMLIHGVKRNRRGLLLPWIVLECVKTLLFFIAPITLLALFGGNEVIIYTSLSFFVAIGLEVYFILVVISQYQALGIIRMHNDEINMK